MLFLPVHILHLPKRKPRLQRKSWLHRVFPQGAKILKYVEAKKKSRLHRIFPHSAKILKHVEAKKKSRLHTCKRVAHTSVYKGYTHIRA